MTDTRARCKATTKSGSQCRLTAQPGADYCHVHADFGDAQESATQTAESAMQSETSSGKVDPAVDTEPIRDSVEELPPLADDVPEYDETPPTADATADEFEADTTDFDQAADEIEQEDRGIDRPAEVVEAVVSEMRSESGQRVEVQSDEELEAASTVTSTAEEMLVASQGRQGAMIDDASYGVQDEIDTKQAAARQENSQPDRTATEERVVEDLDVVSSEDEPPPFEADEPLYAEDSDESVAEPRQPSPQEQQIATLVAEVESLAQELCRRLDQSGFHASTPAQTMELFNQHVGKYAPETQRALFADIQRNLQDARYRDLADPDVLRGLWYMLYFALQNQSQEVRERVARQLSSIPGYEHMTELGRRVQAASADRSVTTQSGQGMMSALNHFLQRVLRAIRKLLSVGSEN